VRSLSFSLSVIFANAAWMCSTWHRQNPQPHTPRSHCGRPKQVYNQIARMPAGTARRDALRLTKKKAKSLPRVTAYATAG
jgi:hypothetical protein